MKQLTVIIALIAILFLALCAFTINERQYAAQFRLGKIVKTDFEPGLHWKLPWENVIKFDNRILTLDAEPERFITAESKFVIVDSFVKWRINDVRVYYTSTLGDEFVARTRLNAIIADGLRAQFAKRTLQEVVSTEREQIMQAIRQKADEVAGSLGIAVVDVRVKKIDLPPEVSSSVFRRMEADRERVARELRAEGDEQAKGIRAEADREAKVTLAEAERDSAKFRGRGDATAAALYATAYDRNRDFYSFHRSLEAYRKTFTGANDVMLLDAESEFFNFFDQQRGDDSN